MSVFTPAPQLRPRPCLGSLLDIPSGRYHKGKYGDNILNGGFSNFMGIGGRGNTFKTALTISMNYTVLDRYPGSDLTIYDAEITAAWDRLEDMAVRYSNIDFQTMVDEGRIILTSAAEHSGNEWWKAVRDLSAQRQKDAKKLMVETPFLDRHGNPLKMMPPSSHFLDSISQLETDAISDIYEKNEIDASAAQTDAMRSAGIKTRLVMQVPSVTSNGGLFLTTTAHIGDEIKIDPYAPAKQQLAFLKKGLKFKNTPEKFTFLTSGCWVVSNAEPLLNASSKSAEYPLPGHSNREGDTDLQILTMINIRSKSGPTGHVFKLIISQTEGLLSGLSEYHYLKTRKDKFGLLGPEGITKDYRLAIYPDVLLKRTTVRAQIDEDPRLKRALEITSELAQIYDYWPDFPSSDRIKPKDLFTKLTEYGYDWSVLLDTRGYWTFDHYNHPVKPLSTMDLIDMYFGRYVPFWYPDQDKLKLPNNEKSNVVDLKTAA